VTLRRDNPASLKTSYAAIHPMRYEIISRGKKKGITGRKSKNNRPQAAVAGTGTENPEEVRNELRAG